MYKLLLVSLLACSTASVAAQTTATADAQKSFTAHHKSITITYGVSTLFNVAPFIKSNQGIDNSGSFAVGPLAVLYNRGLSDHFSIQFGPTAMFYRDKYKYEVAGPAPGQANLILLGFTTGFNYHFATTNIVDPYIGVAAGVGYYTSSGGADQASLRLKGDVPVLYSGKIGMNVYNKRKNAWTFEVGYDYLSYAKVGYTFASRR